MIQRIQTLFLLGAMATLVVLFFIPLGHLIPPNDMILDFYYNGIEANEFVENAYQTIPLTVLMSLTMIFCLITILMYKNRILQIRLCGINIFLIIGQTGMFLYYFFHAAKQIDAEKQFNISIVLPIVAIIFLYLAIRGIARDEALVKAADRIR
jgi:glucan phosphoethanolaminetransferase (alkaline phosphatase superfamily)